MIIINAYKQLKSFGNLKTANEVYTSIITNSLSQMFDYKTDMSEISTIRFENLLLSTGMATLYKWKDKTVPVFVRGAGMKNPDDTYEYYIGQYINGTDSFELPTDYPICFNTGDKQPAMNILRFADMLSEVDLSMVFNLQRSRLAPVPIAKNRAIREQIKNILDGVKNGNYETICADLDHDFITGKANSIEMLNLNDPKAIEYMNYLSELHDCLTRRIYTLYGMAIQETSKHAQVNEDESNARDGVSWLIPDNMLRMRKEFIKKYNEYAGTDFSVDYNKLFKAEREIMEQRKEVNNDTTGNVDNTANSNTSDNSTDSDPDVK